ncbi:3D domain-containing protein [Dendrosporobacter sp. 1207_IL3150]|uniref:3D domain-containing protein n=1 Tax=Dendrosporobacter sp. 1207_IL3150 TaxID=3084054 RepID=UPI002FD8AD71
MNNTQPKNSQSKGRMMALIAALITVLLLATGFIWANKKVHIAADGGNLVVSTYHSNPNDILAKAGVVLGPQDEYRISTPKLISGSTITVYRAVPVTVVYQGVSKTFNTGKPTVGELADSLGLLNSSTKLVPNADEKIQAGMQIQAIKLSEQIIERTENVPYQVVHQPDSTLEKGVEELVEEGRAGVKIVTVKQHFADGVQASEEVIEEKVKEPSKPKIVRLGTRDVVETSRGTHRFKRVEWMEATAYLPTDGSPEGITATGIPARRGIVAVDPDVIPLGTRVYIPGYGLALAADTGGAINGNTVDLCMESSSEAWRFGRRMVKVYVLAE